ncbi:uncharacterized protein LOC106013900 [Aplysia californica]|uniref:Uncharacterized protein LOC106013900 n=1 Tax=Aplysia californica TaxID=6500 RepID=A0ABM1AEL8_APLCA|nr:uncharacterized protein LOC106013900 [Aplysia californica]
MQRRGCPIESDHMYDRTSKPNADDLLYGFGNQTTSLTDPMLCGNIEDDFNRFLVSTTESNSPMPALALTQSSSHFTLPVDSLLNPEPGTFSSDLAMWGNHERKRVKSIKEEDDDTDVFSSSASNVDIDLDLEDFDSKSTCSPVMDIKRELGEDMELDDNVSSLGSPGSQNGEQINRLGLSVTEARDYVEMKYMKASGLPRSEWCHQDKIKHILNLSDCSDYTVEHVLSFDRKCKETAHACAKIVQNIQIQYRWDCVEPEDIPCCYTIVSDCKKTGGRTKPPRPMNAFMIWSQGARRMINELCPRMQNADISAALGEAWRLKPDVLKRHFEEEKVKLKRFHNAEFPSYKYKPLTKVQKAKEKQAQSLSKANARSAIQKGKKRAAKSPAPSENIQDGAPTPKRPKGGRPKKSSVDQQPKRRTKELPSYTSTVGTSPTKPAIKDKLTLKILDRRSKGVSPPPPLQGVIHGAFGQPSPPEVTSPELLRIFKEEPIETVAMDQRSVCLQSQVVRSPVRSSVYLTPVSSPASGTEEQRLSPPNVDACSSPLRNLNKLPRQLSSSPPLSASSPSSSSTCSPQPTAVPQFISRPNNPSPSSLAHSMTSTTARMPYISAMLAAPAKTLSQSLPSTDIKPTLPVVMSSPSVTTRTLPAEVYAPVTQAYPSFGSPFLANNASSSPNLNSTSDFAGFDDGPIHVETRVEGVDGPISVILQPIRNVPSDPVGGFTPPAGYLSPYGIGNSHEIAARNGNEVAVGNVNENTTSKSSVDSFLENVADPSFNLSLEAILACVNEQNSSGTSFLSTSVEPDMGTSIDDIDISPTEPFFPDECWTRIVKQMEGEQD